MKAPNLSGRDRRALLVGALMIMPALLYVYAVKPYTAALSATRERLRVERRLLARERAALAAAQRFPEVVGQVREALFAEAPRLFAGADPLAATAALADYVGGHAAGNRVLVQQRRSRKAELLESGLRALRVDIRAVGDIAGMLSFLYALEQGPKLVRVGPVEIARARGYPGRGDEGMEVLRLRATVTGYALAVDGRAFPAPTAVATAGGTD